ncbi:MAG: YqaE/Pmp3 family membrane protein, partial [Anaerolineae bacterium]|nr:YqaE/Pmp3 family membrane protein [Anaerolineae bacterium]
MGCLRAILCFVIPPLAVLDRGCGSILIVTLLWLGGFHIGGVLAALFINYMVDDRKHKY